MPRHVEATPSSRARLARLYAAWVGYDPFADCPAILPGDVLAVLREYRAAAR